MEVLNKKLKKLKNRNILNFQILQHSTNWGMDMFAVGELTNERPLTSICFTIFKVSFSSMARVNEMR